MNAYSEDLRKKIVDALRRGAAKAEVARAFGVSRSSVKRYAKLAEEGRPLAPKKGPGLRPKLDGAAERLLEEDLEERPAAEAAPEARVSAAGGGGLGERVHREPSAETPGLQPKKRSLGAAERDEFLRAAWRTLVAGGIDQARLVFVDEMGANVSLSPLYAWSRRGQRAYAKAPRNRGKNVTLLASITAEGVGRWTPCLSETPAGSSGTAATARWVNRYDERSRRDKHHRAADEVLGDGGQEGRGPARLRGAHWRDTARAGLHRRGCIRAPGQRGGALGCVRVYASRRSGYPARRRSSAPR